MACHVLAMGASRAVFGVTGGGSLQQPAPTLTPGAGCRARPPLDTLSPNVADPRAARTVQAAVACAGMTAEEQTMPLVDFVNLKVPVIWGTEPWSAGHSDAADGWRMLPMSRPPCRAGSGCCIAQWCLPGRPPDHRCCESKATGQSNCAPEGARHIPAAAANVQASQHRRTRDQSHDRCSATPRSGRGSRRWWRPRWPAARRLC